MKWIARSIGVACLLLIMLSVVSAQNNVGVRLTQGDGSIIEFIPQGINDPRVNEIANACYFGGTLSGKCDSTDVNNDGIINTLDTDWMWIAGWHLIRYEYDLVDREYFEPTYTSILPADSIHKIGGQHGCYNVIYGDLGEVFVLWQGGTDVRDVWLHDDSECIDPAITLLENVIAIETDAEAQMACQTDLGEKYHARRFFRSFYECIYYP